MSFKSVVALFIMASVLVCSPLVDKGLAQDTEPKKETDEPTFKLLRDSALTASEAALEDEEEIWIPAIEGGTVEVGFTLGLLDLNTTLLSHEQMIYKYTEEATYWGDYEIQGDMAFNPILRIGYNLNPWLSVEAVGSFSFSEYTSSAENRVRRSNEVGATPDFLAPEVGEFDLEERSLLTASTGVNAVLYFLNLDGNGEGRFHPFATAGVSNIWYSMNSNFVDEAATAVDFNFGGGIRLLADRNVSIRLEAVFHVNSLEWTPADFYTERDEGTVQVPLDEFPVIEDRIEQRPIESFESNSIGSLAISVGVQGSF